MPRRAVAAVLGAALVGGCAAASVPPSLSSVRAIPTPAPEVTPRPTAVLPTADATRTAAPTPSPAFDPAVLDLEATSCEGGVVLEWSPSRHPDFHHYIALRSPEGEIAPDYPPIAPAVDWGDTYATDVFVTSAVDASIIPSSRQWHYRVMAYDADGDVVSASPVRSARLDPVEPLGPMRAAASDDGGTLLTWGGYGGLSRCFTEYRVLYGTGGVAGTLLTTVSDQHLTELHTDSLQPGTTYMLRVEAVRSTTLGSFVLGQTPLITYTAPSG